MADAAKIATCCYCGARTVLSFGRRGRGVDMRALCCSACGAPVTRLKPLRSGARSQSQSPAPAGEAAPRPPRRRKKSKPRKSAFTRLVEEVMDELEDLIDD